MAFKAYNKKKEESPRTFQVLEIFSLKFPVPHDMQKPCDFSVMKFLFLISATAVPFGTSRD